MQKIELAVFLLLATISLVESKTLGNHAMSTTHEGYQAEHITPLVRNDHRHVETKVQKALRLAEIAKGPPETSDNSLIQKVSAASVGLQVSSDVNSECETCGKHTKVSAVQLETLQDLHYRHSDSEAQGVSAMPLKNVMNSQYTGPISVGTVKKGSCTSAHKLESLSFLQNPANASKTELEACHLEPQSQVWVIFDTGSTNLWIASDQCTTKPCRTQGRGFYDHTKSHTYEVPSGNQVSLDVKFGTGELKGPLGEDDLHLGTFTVKKQRFGLIQEEMGAVFAQIPFEGILGLGFPSMSANGMKPIFDNIIDQHVLKKNEFAFYFNPENPARNAMFWGGVDPNFYEGQIKTFPVTQEHYWALDLHDFKVGTESLMDAMYADGSHGDPPPAMSQMEVDSHGEAHEEFVRKESWSNKYPKLIIDSGTTYYTAEKPLFKQLMQRVKPTSCSLVNDDTYPTIMYTLMDANKNLYDLTIPPHMYMVSDSEGKRCSPAFMEISLPKEYGPGMIMGEVFMRHWYTVFSRGTGKHGSASVGFAKAKHGDKKTEERLDEITKSMPTAGQGAQDIGFSQKEAEEMSQVEKVEEMTGIQEISESSVGLQVSSDVNSAE